MTTYDMVWKTFLNNCKVSDIDLPKTTEKIYEEIKNGVILFNNRMRTHILCHDDTETLSENLSEDDLIILANFIRLVFLINQETYFQSIFQPFASDIGLKNFGTQLKTLETSIAKQKSFIDYLIINTMEDFL